MQLLRGQAVIEKHGGGVKAEARLGPGNLCFHHIHHGLKSILRVVGLEDGFALKSGGAFDGSRQRRSLPAVTIVVLARAKAFPHRGDTVIAQTEVTAGNRAA